MLYEVITPDVQVVSVGLGTTQLDGLLKVLDGPQEPMSDQSYNFV